MFDTYHETIHYTKTYPKQEVEGDIQWLSSMKREFFSKELICMTICPEEGHWHVCIIDQSTDLELW